MHPDLAGGGSASWEELKGALYASHSENEGAYTDDIYDTHLVLDWADQLRGLSVDEYHGIDMRSKYSSLKLTAYKLTRRSIRDVP